MARLARKARADARALEEEAERENPLDGRGATPSMGLSQFRGGRAVGAGSGGYKSGRYEGEGDLHVQVQRRGKDGKMKGGFLPLGLLASVLAKPIGNMLNNLTTGKNVITGKGMDGSGFLSDLGIPVVSDIAGMFGFGEASESDEEPVQCGRRGKGTGGTGAGTGGRAKRAAIVKKVMAEKGLSMINASKYVKQHNLY